MIVLLDLADIMTFVAYVVIPVQGILLYRKANRTSVQLSRFFWFLIGGFIVTCGAGHLTDVVMTWWPEWRFDVFWHCGTGVISLLSMIWITMANMQPENE